MVCRCCGIASNMDQFLNMGSIQKFGAGRLIRADRIDKTKLAAILKQLLQDNQFANHASSLARSWTPDDVLERHINALVTNKEHK